MCKRLLPIRLLRFHGRHSRGHRYTSVLVAFWRMQNSRTHAFAAYETRHDDAPLSTLSPPSSPLLCSLGFFFPSARMCASVLSGCVSALRRAHGLLPCSVGQDGVSESDGKGEVRRRQHSLHAHPHRCGCRFALWLGSGGHLARVLTDRSDLLYVLSASSECVSAPSSSVFHSTPLQLHLPKTLAPCAVARVITWCTRVCVREGIFEEASAPYSSSICRSHPNPYFCFRDFLYVCWRVFVHTRRRCGGVRLCNRSPLFLAFFRSLTCLLPPVAVMPLRPSLLRLCLCPSSLPPSHRHTHASPQHRHYTCQCAAHRSVAAAGTRHLLRVHLRAVAKTKGKRAKSRHSKRVTRGGAHTTRERRVQRTCPSAAVGDDSRVRARRASLLTATFFFCLLPRPVRLAFSGCVCLCVLMCFIIS